MSRYIDIEPLMTPDNIVEEREDTGIDELPYKIRYGLDINVIRNAPTADVVEVRHGKWDFEVKHFFDDYGDLNVYAKGYCSECGKDYPFNATIASEFVEKPDDLVGYAHWDIDVEPIKTQVAHKARENKNLYSYCPYCGAKMGGERREE